MRQAVTVGALMFLGTNPAERRPNERALRGAWEDYARSFVQADGRVIDPSSEGASTSEGQAYAMVRAVWANDEKRFDSVRTWTRNNLQRGDPARLPAWKWGKRADGSWGILDENPASDADQLIAWSLLIAAERWLRPELADEARGLLARIWQEEVAEVLGGRWLLPGPWAAAGRTVVLNPSYFMPFAWRDFAVADPERDWQSLIDPAYTMLASLMAAGRLPPDWVYFSAEDGVREAPPPERADADHYGYEAMRIPWNLAADVIFHDESRARHLLVNFADLGRGWRRSGLIPARMRVDGEPMEAYEHPALYGALLPAWGLVRPEDAPALYANELMPLRSAHGYGGAREYYGQNWVWLGIALWSGQAFTPHGGR